MSDKKQFLWNSPQMREDFGDDGIYICLQINPETGEVQEVMGTALTDCYQKPSLARKGNPKAIYEDIQPTGPVIAVLGTLAEKKTGKLGMEAAAAVNEKLHKENGYRLRVDPKTGSGIGARH